IDINGDGRDEIALIQNITVNGFTTRAITITEKVNNQFNVIDTLYNSSPSSSMNTFTNYVECGYLDDNNIPDVLAADKDGDVMIFENGELIWSYRLPVGNAYYLTTGDFTGNGKTEFCVGGFNFSSADVVRSFSYFAFFGYSAEQETFIPIGSVSFDNLEQKNSVISTNIDDVDDDEIIISAPPNLYIIDYVDNEFIPIWKGNSAKTFNNILVAIPGSEGQNPNILSSYIDAGMTTSCIVSAAETFTGPNTPTGFKAIPTDSTSAYLSWDEHDYDELKIYRKHNGNSVLVGTSNSTEFYDENLTCLETYEYSIVGYDESFDPPSSKNSLWKEVIPSPIPMLTNIKMISPYELKLNFSEKLNNNSINIRHFSVNNEIGIPASVNIIEEKKSLLLSFSTFFENNLNYKIEINGLLGETGIAIPQAEYDFDFEEDIIAPKIISATSTELDCVRIYFSETMIDESVENIDNYLPVFPIIDHSNEIQTIISGIDSHGYYVDLKLKEKLKYSNQNYFIKVVNVQDLAGNTISNDGNKCCFNLTDIIDLKHMIVYPNPLYLNEFNEIRFANLPLEKNGAIRIYDIAGELVYEENFTPLTELKNYYSWNAKNKKGKRVSSGMYLYFIKVGNDYKKGKLAVIH
ncbi:MAG: T9SS type A sorting domain-containing protein, partial [Candidatus Cloacimonetes bacterium]|nr:T9SS type A sorting domain-containing protein [Candidatus Cloacimonadota bacterium]